MMYPHNHGAISHARVNFAQVLNRDWRVVRLCILQETWDR